MERPSLRSTVKVSSVTTTFVAAARSVIEERMPRFQECSFVLHDQSLDLPNLPAAEVTAA